MKRTLRDIDGHPAFLFIQKNASTSISEAMRKVYGPRARNVTIERYDGRPIAVMWRNPAQRLESAYRMFFHRPILCQDRNIPPAHRLPFDTWAWKVLDMPDSERDLHVAQQTRQATDKNGIFMPTVVYRWNFARLMADYGLALDRRNESHDVQTEWTEALVQRHKIAYADDWEQWVGRGPHDLKPRGQQIRG